jgi:simple sugar transport system permease protein
MAFETVLQSIFTAAFVATIIRISTPIILAALGGLIADRAGVVNIALEGMMLAAAFTGVAVSAYAPGWLPGMPLWFYAWTGAAAGILASMLLGLLIAVFHLEFRTDIILTGLAVNILAAGGTVFVMYVLTGDKGSTSTLASPALPNLVVPFVNNLPVVGTLLNAENRTGYNVLSYAAFLLTALISLYLFRTRAGTHLRAAGEAPAAAQTVGIDVRRTQYVALLLSGAVAALGGLNLSMGYLTIFQANMTAGRGFIALAVINLGNRTPGGVLIASLIFGAATALGAQLGTLDVPPQLIEMIPPVVTIAALIIYQLRRRAQIAANTRRFQERAAAGD